jgi:hypothetical protein
MLDFDAGILVLPNIRSGLNHLAHVDDGQIFLGGHTCTPKPISNLAITYFGTNFDQNKSHFDCFTDVLVDVSFLKSVTDKFHNGIIRFRLWSVIIFIQAMKNIL